jgi:hypothetical protein
MKFKTLLLVAGFIPALVMAQAHVNVLPNLRSDPLEFTETPKKGLGEHAFDSELTSRGGNQTQGASKEGEQAYRRFPGQNVDYVKPPAPQVAKPDTLKNSNLQELAPKAGGLTGHDTISRQLPQ